MVTPLGDDCKSNSDAGIPPTRSIMFERSTDGISPAQSGNASTHLRALSGLAYRQTKPCVMGLSPTRNPYYDVRITPSLRLNCLHNPLIELRPLEDDYTNISLRAPLI